MDRTYIKSYIAVFALILSLSGCAAKLRNSAITQKPVVLIAPENLTKPVELLGCDLNSKPLKCKKVRVSYREGTEKIDLQQGEPSK